MKRVPCCLLLLLLWAGCPALAQDDVVMKAMRDELGRSIAQLRLADLEKPYFLAYRVDDLTATKISASLGQLTDKDIYRSRKLAVHVRVGDFKLDNTDFLGGSSGFGGGNCGCHTTLPVDDDYESIRREIWLETDAAYKQAAAELAAKKSVLSRRERGQELPDFTPQPAATASEKPVSMKIDFPVLEQLARDVSAAFTAAPEVFTSGVDIYVVENFARYVNSEGASFTRPEPLVVVDVRAYARAKDGRPVGDAFRLHSRVVSGLSRDEVLSRTRELIAEVKALRTADYVERYNGPVLFEREAAAEVVAQVLAPAVVSFRIPLSDDPQFEAQAQQMLDQLGVSLADRVGARIMPEWLDLVNNPRVDHYGDAALFGAYAIDDEGVPAQEVKIVENGRLTHLLAIRTPTPQTNASTGSARAVGGAPANLFLTAQKTQSGAELRAELLRLSKQRGYDYGIVVRHLGYGAISAWMRLAFQGRSDAGGGFAVYKLFADGHEELVRADIAPIPLTALKEIVSAGKVPTVYHGAFMPFGPPAGAGYEASGEGKLVVVSFVVPPLLFDELSLKRPEGSAPKLPILPSPLAAAK